MGVAPVTTQQGNMQLACYPSVRSLQCPEGELALSIRRYTEQPNMSYKHLPHGTPANLEQLTASLHFLISGHRAQLHHDLLMKLAWPVNMVY